MNRERAWTSAWSRFQSMLILITTFSLCSRSDKSGVLCFADPSSNVKPHTRGIHKSVSSTFKSLKLPDPPSLTDDRHSKRNGMILSSGSTSSTTIDVDRDGEKTAIPSSQTNSNQKLQPPNESIIPPSFWPSGDELDKRLIKIALPCIANFAINPLISAIDLIWINRIGNPLAIAGQAAANQVFNSLFWLTSFLPSVTATLVAKESAKKSTEGVQDAVGQALIVGLLMAMFGSTLLLSKTEYVLSSVLHDGAPALQFAKPYLLIRGLAFLPSLVSLIGFSAFRGVMDTITPLKISLFANLFNVILDPLLIFKAKLGVSGAALASLSAEFISAITFAYVLWKRNMIKGSKLFKLPSWSQLSPLLKAGAALQLRNFSLNVTFLAVTRVTQSIDKTGVAAAAHALAIQTFQLGGIVLLALSTVAQIVVPSELVERVDPVTGVKSGGIYACKIAVNRLMSWGLILGVLLGGLQILFLPLLNKATPLLEVRQAAMVPSYLASAYQIINGLVFIGEGVMIGTGNFWQLSINTFLATVGTLWALRTFPSVYGLTGIWMSFGVFNTIRLLGVLKHQLYTSPIARAQIAKQ